MKKSCQQFGIRSTLLVTMVVAVSMPLLIWVWSTSTQNMGPWRRVSPFTAITVGPQKTMVQCNGQPYELLSIEGVAVGELLNAAGNTFGKNDAEKRFVEDIAEVLEAAGKDRWADSVKLVLKDPSDGRIVTINNAPMTEDNRRFVMRARLAANRRMPNMLGQPETPSLEPVLLVAGRWRRVSPFTAAERRDDQLIVEYEGKTYELTTIEGVPVAELIRTAEVTFGKRLAEKRLVEDIAEVLGAAGKNSNADVVELVLRDPANGQVVTIDQAPMTAQNRDLLMRRRWMAQRAAPRSSGGLSSRDERGLREVVDEFETALQERWSYFPLGDVRLTDGAEELRQAIRSGEVTSKTIRYELNKIIARGIDGHASVAGGGPTSGGRFLPFLIEPIGVEPETRRLVAFLPDRSQFVSKSHPYLTKIDGRPIDEWIDVARVCNPQGSPQYVLRHALRELRALPHWRDSLGQPTIADVVATLTNADGTETIDVSIPLAGEKPYYGSFPRGTRLAQAKARLTDQGIGYLRLVSMDDPAVQTIHDTMAELRKQKYDGLVVDVRGNGGGSRDALRTLFSYLSDESETPRVFNAAVYRTFSEFDDNHLVARFMYRRDDPMWSAAERAAIDEFAQDFRPAWDPTDNDYSEWHYMVLSRLADHPYFRFRGPVVVLMDAKCFSATDIFLAGLKGWSNVTLMGQASGGGSARSATARLAGGEVKVRLGSMVSYQADGRLFDGNGVDPDVVVLPTPESFLNSGQDNLIDRAAELIANRANSGKN